MTKFSVRNPEHEEAMAAILAPYVERVFQGHNFSGMLNFPRRIATTYLNAAVYPVHKDFFEAVQKALASRGVVVPLRILRPDGGNMSFDSSVDYPAQNHPVRTIGQCYGGHCLCTEAGVPASYWILVEPLPIWPY